MKKNRFLMNAAAGLIAVALMFTSCSKDDVKPAEPNLEVERTVINAPAEGGVYVVKITSNVTWTVTVSANSAWCIVSPLSKDGDGDINITVTANETIIPLTATLTVTAGDIVKEITVNQAAAGVSFGITPNNVTDLIFSPDGITATLPDGTAAVTAFSVTANIEWNAESNQTWLHVTKNATGTQFTITADENPVLTRPAPATVTVSTADGSQMATINVTQAGCAGIIYIENLTGSSVSVNYTDGTAASNLTKSANNKIYLPENDNDKTIRSITPEGVNAILAGRKADGSVIALKLNGTQLVFRDAVNGAVPVGTYAEFQLMNTALSGSYRQEAHLDMLDENFTPIGLQPATAPFEGVFDGNGLTLANLKIIVSAYPGVGLFGWIYGGTAKNINIVSGSVKGNEDVGGICGYANYGAFISNCTNAAAVEGTAHIGGICGGIEYQNNSKMENCSNSGNITGTDYVGGIIGYDICNRVSECHNTGAVSGEERIGGICGYVAGELINCTNTGAVSGEAGIGGICGYAEFYGYSSLNYTVYLCSNSGTITGGAASYYVGGIVGYNDMAVIYSCYNTADINGNSRVSGIVGENGGYITACYNTGNITGTEYISGICGKLTYAAISACYNIGTIRGGEWTGGISGAGPDYYFHACYNTGAVYSSYSDQSGGITGLAANPEWNFWVDLPNDDVDVAVGAKRSPWYMSPDEDYNIYKFSATDWPSVTSHLQWGVGNGQGDGQDYDDGCGEEGIYWKDLGSWNDGNPVYPKLWFENASSQSLKGSYENTKPNDRSKVKGTEKKTTDKPLKKKLSESSQNTFRK
ncbi:MAG: BACON domain-containing protein [Prevotellaceae bacterium]|jgi:hypothetical protein|nr:BACON domain-containing protein [Prevotellaceae bacterium]